MLCLDNMLTSGPAAVTRLRDQAGFEFRYCDIRGPFQVRGEVDLILHLACPASPTAYARYPVQTMEAGSHGTEHAPRPAAVKGARFVLASTPEVYVDPLCSPQPETYRGNVNPVGPRSVYDEAKRYAEALTMAYARDGRVGGSSARVFNSYGRGMRPDDGRMVPTFTCQARRGGAGRHAGRHFRAQRDHRPRLGYAGGAGDAVGHR